MKKIIFHLVFILLLASSVRGAWAQTIQGGISGKVVNSEGQPAAYATVTLLKAADSSLVKGAITDENGAYRFVGTSSGTYRIMASQIGMNKVYTPAFLLSADGSHVLKPLVLTPNTQALKAVSVTASKPFIQHDIDKTIVNVANSAVSAGNNAWEILQKSPGVTVDNSNNTIQLLGKTGVVVYVDGKPTYLSKDQLADMLKNMDASSIESLEIMTQPSAKYDAAGNAGIINIVTRKSRQTGLNGDLTLGFGEGKRPRENAGGNINYHTGKVNLYGNYYYSHAIWWNDNYITRNFYDGQNKALSTRTEQHGTHLSPSNSHSFKAGIDYSLDTRNTLGFMMSGSVNPGSNTLQNMTWFKNPDGSIQTTSLTHNENSHRWTNFTYDLNYRGVYDSTGRELDVDVAYSKFDNSTDQHFHTDTYDADGVPVADLPDQPNPNIRKGSIPSIIDIKTAKVDYTLPVNKKTKLEFGAKYSMVTSNNNVRYNKLDNKTQQWLYDSATNHFKYTENINAVYGNLKKQLSKGWSFQLGLRGEQTVSNGHQYTNDSTVKRNYFQLFPSVYVSKQLDKNNLMNFSYSRRIDRPDYQDLNPFRYYLDPYTYEEGNPFLQPQLSNTVKLTYAYKSLFSAALSYGHVSDVMSQVLKQDDSAKVTYQTEENLSQLQNIGLDLTFSIPVTKWWMSNDFVNVFNNRYKGTYLGGELDFNSTAFTFNTTNTFTLPKHFTAELTGYYSSRMLWSIFTIDPQYIVSVGLQKTILKDKGTLKLNLSDVFNTMHSSARVKYQNLDVTSKNHWDSQRVSLSFTYRFSKGNIKPEHRHQSAIEEEQSRIKK